MIIAEPGRETEAALRLGRIGFDYVAGYLEGGMQALTTRPDLLRRTERITAAHWQNSWRNLCRRWSWMCAPHANGPASTLPVA